MQRSSGRGQSHPRPGLGCRECCKGSSTPAEVLTPLYHPDPPTAVHLARAALAVAENRSCLCEPVGGHFPAVHAFGTSGKRTRRAQGQRH